MKPRMLPYMEQVALYNSLNMSTTYGNPPNSTARGTQVNTVLCPSDTNNPSSQFTLPGGGGATAAYHSYPNNIGTYLTNNSNQFDGPAYILNVPANGLVLTLANITDGASNTVIFSEFIRGKNDGGVTVGNHQIYTTTDPDNVVAALAKLAQDCQNATTFNHATKGSEWLTNICGKGGGYSHIQTPNKKSCWFSNATGGTGETTLVGASSYHAGGVNVGFLDGSVRFIKDSINPTTWWAIATRANGEVVSADSY